MEPTISNTGEHRVDRRFPLWVAVTLEDGPDEAVKAATLVDLSAGGAFVKLAPEVEAASCGRLRVVSGGESRTVAYEVVAVEKSWEGTFLHVRFTGDGAAEAHLEPLLVELASESTDMQRWIASGRAMLGRVRPGTSRRLHIS
ncbi:MAG: PilZ domain-containing protein [Dehalococcoidia bacterium]